MAVVVVASCIVASSVAHVVELQVRGAPNSTVKLLAPDLGVCIRLEAVSGPEARMSGHVLPRLKTTLSDDEGLRVAKPFRRCLARHGRHAQVRAVQLQCGVPVHVVKVKVEDSAPREVSVRSTARNSAGVEGQVGARKLLASQLCDAQVGEAGQRDAVVSVAHIPASLLVVRAGVLRVETGLELDEVEAVGVEVRIRAAGGDADA